MNFQKKKKYCITTTNKKPVILAEIPPSHHKVLPKFYSKGLVFLKIIIADTLLGHRGNYIELAIALVGKHFHVRHKDCQQLLRADAGPEAEVECGPGQPSGSVGEVARCMQRYCLSLLLQSWRTGRGHSPTLSPVREHLSDLTESGEHWQLGPHRPLNSLWPSQGSHCALLLQWWLKNRNRHDLAIRTLAWGVV